MNDHITVIYFLVEGQEIKFSPQASTLLCAKFRPLLGGGGQQRRLTPNKPLHVLVGLGLGRHILGCPRFWHRTVAVCLFRDTMMLMPRWDRDGWRLRVRLVAFGNFQFLFLSGGRASSIITHHPCRHHYPSSCIMHHK
jgi:hypothetical protein